MADSFAALKRSRETSSDVLAKEIQKLSTKGGSKEKDARFWQPEVDKTGNGVAIIRFLPAPNGEDVPYVRLWSHGFQGTGGWYIENSLTTIGGQDPIGELNNQLWNSGNDADKKRASAQKRKLSYIANIMVVSDPKRKENEGKVFLYKFGKKIFDKINALMNPEFEGDEKVNPFDMWAGANFKLKIRQVEGYRNYDMSEFAAVSAIADNDDDIETIWKQEHLLSPFIAPDQFKSYEELKKQLERAMGAPKERTDERDDSRYDDTPKAPARDANVGKSRPAPKAPSKDEDDDDMAFFKKLATDDDEIPF